MYHTPEGDRVLRGAERRLFVHALAIIVDAVRDGEAEFGIEVFDDLQPSQKLAILYRAARALLDPDAPMPKLTAVLEGAVGTVYQFIRDMVLMEIEDAEIGLNFRSLVCDAAIETGVTERPPRPESRKRQRWDILIECLEELVLWDDDFSDQHRLDIDPETSQRVKEFLGIDDDYYTEVAPDPRDHELNSYLDALRRLTSEAR